MFICGPLIGGFPAGAELRISQKELSTYFHREVEEVE